MIFFFKYELFFLRIKNRISKYLLSVCVVHDEECPGARCSIFQREEGGVQQQQQLLQ